MHFDGDPSEDHIGPFFYHSNGELCETALRLQAHHMNNDGNTHGGVLMMFADYSLCMAALLQNPDGLVTVNCNNDFIDASKDGDLVIGHTRITKRTRSMAFPQCTLSVEDRPILTASAVIKLFKN